MSLEVEIETAAHDVSTDSYTMSVGEVISMYRDGELTLNPDFQRLFRWTILQQSRFVESLLIGIPVPPIFVFEAPDGKWEVVDGLQRLSTVLKFCGELTDPDTGKRCPQSRLVATRYLPSLENVVWTATAGTEGIPLGFAQQRAIKRARLIVQMLRRGSDNRSKFDLFQRLNSYGAPAKPQELRNCLMVMLNSELKKMVDRLSNDADVRALVSSDNSDMLTLRAQERMCRLLVFSRTRYDEQSDVEEYVDRGIESLATSGMDLDGAERRVLRVFQIIRAAEGDVAFRRFNGENFVGRFLEGAFEVIAVGVFSNLEAIESQSNPIQFLSDKIRAVWGQPASSGFYGSGLSGRTRIMRTVPFGIDFFRP